MKDFLKWTAAGAALGLAIGCLGVLFDLLVKSL